MCELGKELRSRQSGQTYLFAASDPQFVQLLLPCTQFKCFPFASLKLGVSDFTRVPTSLIPCFKRKPCTCFASSMKTICCHAQALLYHLSVLEDGGAAAHMARWKAQQLRDGCANHVVFGGFALGHAAI